MDWITNLYNETRKVWKSGGKDPKGYAIFYSPVKIKPTIALIGYNPGGDEKSFDEENVSVPREHEYFTDNYKLAKNVKKIFETADSIHELEQSVKFNLIFFRSKLAKDINNKQMIDFCENNVLYILNEIKPKYIITEGFNTFEKLKKLLKGTEQQVIKFNNKAIMVV